MTKRLDKPTAIWHIAISGDDLLKGDDEMKLKAKKIDTGLYTVAGYEIEKFDGEWRLYHPGGDVSVWATKAQAMKCVAAELEKA